ncbi:MAG: Transcription elongation factor spt6 [Chrysothrix sp. TS-e1954]|nr:MAG: Transcription elongation factor spt6 [Chrysothrix sp. TS-e1954]
MTTLFDLDAEVGRSDEDEDYEAANGEGRSNNANGLDGNMEDSSEEGDDDDEEAEAEVRKGFIVDDPEDDGERRRKKRKRRREAANEERDDVDDEALDEEDLDLIGVRPASPQESKFKRLKRGHRGDDSAKKGPAGLDDIFADDDDLDDRRPVGRGRDHLGADLDDFIEQDEFSDEDPELRDELEVTRRPNKGLAAINNYRESGLDEAAIEDMDAAFGNGNEYDWVLQQEEDEEDAMGGDPDKPIELKDVFEPSQLVERMLTDEDAEIRETDVPERYQIARKPFKTEELTEEEQATLIAEESTWVTQMLLPKKSLDQTMREPFRKSIASILRFMNVENLEVPFIFQHRKDYLIHSEKDERGETLAQKLLDQDDLWEILELDLKYRALRQKRQALQRSYDAIREVTSKPDEVIESMLPVTATMEDVQDLQDYMHFQYSAELKDIALQTEVKGTQKKSRASRGLFERMRASGAYNVVRGFGVTPDAFAQSILDQNMGNYTDDPPSQPDDMADQYTDADFSTGTQVLKAAKAMFADELTMSPRLRKVMKGTYFNGGYFDCNRTEKGLKRIDEDHPYYELKYLRNLSIRALSGQPELYLRMLKAEQEGLIQVSLRLSNKRAFRSELQKALLSDNFSTVADAWNSLRQEVLELAILKLERLMVKSVKENLKTEMENQLAKRCRSVFSKKLDVAPYKPKGMISGTTPRVLAFTNGNGMGGPDSITWIYMEEDGRVLENGKFSDMRVGIPEKDLPDSPDIASFNELVDRRKPDVIGVSGFTVETRTLAKQLQNIINHFDLRGAEFEDEEEVEDRVKREKLDVVMVNDEVARLYHTSEQSRVDFPQYTPLTKYCIALARYLHNPLKEYASLGRNITSILFDPSQHLIPQQKLMNQLDTAMVDIVNLVGVDVDDLMSHASVQNLLPYICGLGPRKSSAMLQAINRNGGSVINRAELVGDPEAGKVQAVSASIWKNCASFLYIPYDASEPAANYLDNTRVHPEDYDLAKKMAADAMEIDEEDIKAEVEEYGEWAIVRRIEKDNQTERVNDLVLSEYADQILRDFNLKKRATLETIRAEFQTPFEELRRAYRGMDTEEVFTMLTGETNESIQEHMVVAVSIRKVFSDHLEVRMDNGIEGGVSESEFPSGIGGGDGVDPRQVFQPRQAIQAKITFLDRRTFVAQLTLREDEMRRVFRKEIDRNPGEWDHAQEDDDKRDAARKKDEITGRAQRVIKHPAFHPFNSTQAEEFLGPLNRGDVVIRPSSKGLDHLAVTWKVSDNIFRHIDVLELDKVNEFAVGKILRVAGKYSYADLDELIEFHIKPMAKKVDEMMGDERFNVGGRTEAEQWLTSYLEANPSRSMYNFYINREHPGYFNMCIKPGYKAAHLVWPVKIVPGAFELKGNEYPDVRALKNGFKTLWEVEKGQSQRAKAPPPVRSGPGMGGMGGMGMANGYATPMAMGMGRRY